MSGHRSEIFRVIRRTIQSFWKDRSGTVAIEAAFILPVLFMTTFGVAQIGVVLNKYIALTDATGAGVRQLTVERGFSTPYTDTVNQIHASAPDLAAANLTIALSVNGAACASDAACTSALSSAQGQAAQVTVTYTCNLQFTPLIPNLCPLSSTILGRIQ
jgi:Flp pilus assembly protein TadG